MRGEQIPAAARMAAIAGSSPRARGAAPSAADDLGRSPMSVDT
ncbi:hypothetical protein B005_4381 [Nocardiopsis alba ATCC BAA-2165]|uniref:Uncharacterized protein n=1 Tax=Nocardiopsis alba (strain ATCC BAA-2165 / BE74) TaxID=1205910 RepID=J7L894_NOCAA|nr:hypothetical protein B005_4381 [Nocardiopsis alba ATCC BAA-2165]